MNTADGLPHPWVKCHQIVDDTSRLTWTRTKRTHFHYFLVKQCNYAAIQQCVTSRFSPTIKMRTCLSSSLSTHRWDLIIVDTLNKPISEIHYGQQRAHPVVAAG